MDKIFALCRELGATVTVRYSPEHDSWYFKVERKYLGHRYVCDRSIFRNQLENMKSDAFDLMLDEIREKLSNDSLIGIYKRQISMAEYGLE